MVKQSTVRIICISEKRAVWTFCSRLMMNGVHSTTCPFPFPLENSHTLPFQVFRTFSMKGLLFYVQWARSCLIAVLAVFRAHCLNIHICTYIRLLMQMPEWKIMRYIYNKSTDAKILILFLNIVYTFSLSKLDVIKTSGSCKISKKTIYFTQFCSVLYCCCFLNEF